VSAAPFGAAPVSAVPVSAPPPAAWYPQTMPAAPVAPPPRRGRTGVILLTISTVLLLITTLAGAGLFLWKFNEADKLTKQTTQQSALIESKNKELETLRKDADDALREKGEQTSRADEADKRGDALAKCVKSIYDFWDLIDDNASESKIQKAGKAIDKACDAANKYL
jgi:hypothetical protein